MKINENERIEKYFDLAREQKKYVEHEGDGSSNFIWWAWNGSQMDEKKGGIGNQRNNPNHLDCCIVKIG